MKEMERMKQLIEWLDAASRAYYQGQTEIMSNLEYDRLYDELLELEKKTGVVMANSPSVTVGYEVHSELPKETHASRMLSLNKTKEVEELKSFLGKQEGVLSWKMDGLTVVLTYENGELYKAVTRGNGEVGEVITPNARTFVNLPHRIPFTGHLVLRGEAVIRYDDFEAINESIDVESEHYKNPRNLCSGSVRQLNSEITAKRRVRFYAFALITAQQDTQLQGEEPQFQTCMQQLAWLQSQGFDVVEHFLVTSDSISERVRSFADAVASNTIPSDGLVLLLNDIAYGASLGTTAKYPRNAIAFKWEDEQAETTLKEIEWSPSRTGRINPVAVFEPVELEGTTVSRASVHNLSIMDELELGLGDRILVYKANMIIPQIAENLTRSGHYPVPAHCPVCKADTMIRDFNGTRELLCNNPKCPVKGQKRFSLFVSRDALNVTGMSEATIEKFSQIGIIKTLPDLFRMEAHRERIVTLEGFGEKSYQNLMASVAAAAKTTLPKLLYGLGMEGIGLANAKALCKAMDYDIKKIMHATMEELTAIDGIGEVLAGNIVRYMADEDNQDELKELLQYVHYEKEVSDTVNARIAGKTFVITGDVKYYANRKMLQEEIEANGGKVASSVSSKTDYLINNDTMSSSSKNKKAKQLNIPIISEEEYRAMLNEKGKQV